MSEFKTIEIADLEFDKQNPRLPSSLIGSDDRKIIRYLAEETAIEDLMTSIGENDFFLGEAIVVTPSDEGTDSRYVVLEGNRRLAALRLLQNPSLAGNIRLIHRVAGEAEFKPNRLPAFVVESRNDVLQYLGFRHITGVQRWEPLAKARYLKMLFDRTDESMEPQQRYAAVAREIGSRSNAVRRNLDALIAYEIIEESGFFDIGELDEETFQFGVFYTAIGNTEVATFIGIRRDGQPTHPSVTPDSIKLEFLQELTKWMFERNDRGETRLGESRNIGKMGDVVADEAALQAFRRGLSLDSAFNRTVGAKQVFMRNMANATDSLQQANSILHTVTPSDEDAVALVREAMEILNVTAGRLGLTEHD